MESLPKPERYQDFRKVIKLSTRELEVFELLATGATTKQIAKEMQVSPDTIEAHCAHIRKKFLFRHNAMLRVFSVHYAYYVKSFTNSNK